MQTFKTMLLQNHSQGGDSRHCWRFVSLGITYVHYLVVCPWVRLSSATFVRPTQEIEIFGKVSTLFGTLAISDLSVKILPRSSQGNPSVRGLNATQKG